MGPLLVSGLGVEERLVMALLGTVFSSSHDAPIGRQLGQDALGVIALVEARLLVQEVAPRVG